LGVGGWQGEREGEGQILGKIASGSPPPWCPSTRGQDQGAGDGERAGREGRGGRLGLPLDRVCKEREEKKRRKEEKKSLAEIHLKFEI
jgi:hypothetical protein